MKVRDFGAQTSFQNCHDDVYTFPRDFYAGLCYTCLVVARECS
jgi:hypothetical protein